MWKNTGNSCFKNLRLSGSICGSVQVLCLLVFFVAHAVCAGPRLFCENPLFDFGNVIEQDEITHEFILTNVGDEPVRISNIKNCCGTKSTIDPLEILPGSNAVCTTVFTTKNRYGKQEKQILIASNDRNNPYFELKMIGELLMAIEVSPRYLRLNDLSVGSKINQTITAKNMTDQPVVLESVKSTAPGIVAEVVGGETSGQKRWAIKLTTTEQLQAGKLRGQIQLNFSTGRVTVPVLGTVKPSIQVVPESIRISSSSDQVIERLVMLKSEQPFEVLSANLGSVDTPVQISRVTEHKWKLALKLKPSEFSGGSLQVKTTCPVQSDIVIPISIR